MKQSEFFENDNEVNLEDLQGRFAVIAKKVNRLQEKNPNWEDTDEFKKVVEILGPLAPIDFLEALQKHYQKTLNKFLKDDLLSLMDECDIDKFELRDGTRLKIVEKLNGTTKGCDQSKRLAWVISHGLGDYIKETLEFPKGELDKEIIGYLDKHGLTYNRKSDINTTSFIARLKELKAAGEELPGDDIIKLTPFRYVEVK